MRSKVSLKATITASVLLMAFVPLLVLGVSSYYILDKALTEEITKKNYALSTSITREIETFLTESLSLLNQVSDTVFTKRLLGVIEPAQNEFRPSPVFEYLSTVVQNSPYFDMIGYIDYTGDVILITPHSDDHLGINLSGHPFFYGTLTTQKPYWSLTFLSLQSGQPTLTLSIPCKDGLLVGYLNLQSLTAITEKQFTKHTHVIITDQNGTIISHKDPQKVAQRENLRHIKEVQDGLAGKTGSYITEIDDEEYLSCIIQVPQTGWLVMHFQELRNALLPKYSVSRLLVFGALVTGGTALLISLIVLRHIFSPLNKLMENARSIEKGDYSPQEKLSTYSEIEELQKDFELMTKAISHREHILKESEHLHRSLIESIPYGIVENDLDGNIVFYNKAFEQLIKASATKKVHQSIFSIGPTIRAKRKMKKYFSFLRKKEPVPEPYYTHGLALDGSLIDLQIDWHYKRDAKGTLLGFVSIITDVTEKNILENKLRQSQKLEAIGTLTGGIAHDFNNILTAILGYAELVLDNLDPQSPDYQDQLQIIQGSNRAKDLIQHLLIFSRKNEQTKSPIEIHLVVKEALKLIRASLPSTIIFKDDIEDCGTLIANPTQIHQIIMNLCTNSGYAMKKGGTLTVSLHKILLDQKTSLANKTEAGEYLQLEVHDTGSGIAQDVQERIFDPFFTTKEVGEGTGMGLPVVHGIVQSHNGFIDVQSEPGQGTRVTILLPATESELPVTKTDSDIHTGNGEHILIIDDEKAIVNLYKVTLVRLGYHVTTATDPVSSISLIENKPFDLIITDQTMPHLTGTQLAQQIYKFRPDIPIILFSGLNIDVPKDLPPHTHNIQAFVKKPLRKQFFANTVHSILQKKWPHSSS